MEKEELIAEMDNALFIAKRSSKTDTGIVMPEGGVPKRWREDICLHFNRQGYRVGFDDKNRRIHISPRHSK